MTPIRMAFPLMRKSKASSPRCSTSQRATIAPWKPISTRSVVSNGPGRINQAFSVRSSTWPKSQLRADWAINDALAGLVGSPLTTIETVEQAMAARAAGLTSSEPAPAIAPEVATPLINAMLDRQYRATLDEPVGMLGDITPRMLGAVSEKAFANGEIGRASCRESVGQYVSISVVAVSLKKQIKIKHTDPYDKHTRQRY